MWRMTARPKPRVPTSLAPGISCSSCSSTSFLSCVLALRFGARMADAEKLLVSGRYADAAALLEQLRVERPDDRALLNNLSVAYRRAGMGEQSFEVLKDGQTVDPLTVVRQP